MRRLLPLLLLLIPLSANSAPKPCDITKLAPVQSLAPLRYLRFTVITESRAGGNVFLVDEVSELTSSQVPEGARATLIEWKNIVLEPGEYEVQWVTAGCTARARVIVSGGDGF